MSIYLEFLFCFILQSQFLLFKPKESISWNIENERLEVLKLMIVCYSVLSPVDNFKLPDWLENNPFPYILSTKFPNDGLR